MNLLFYFDLLIEQKNYQELIINSTRSIILISDKNSSLYSASYPCINQLKKDIQEFCYDNLLRLDPKNPSSGGDYFHNNEEF